MRVKPALYARIFEQNAQIDYGKNISNQQFFSLQHYHWIVTLLLI